MLLSSEVVCIYFDKRKQQNTRSRHLSLETFKKSLKKIVILATTVSSHFYCTCPQQLFVSTRHLPQSNKGLRRRDALQVFTCLCTHKLVRCLASIAMLAQLPFLLDQNICACLLLRLSLTTSLSEFALDKRQLYQSTSFNNNWFLKHL